VRAANRADIWLTANCGASVEAAGVHIRVVHRRGGFDLPRLLRHELFPLDLTAIPEADAPAAIIARPFVVVACDAAVDAKLSLWTGRGVCALASCFDPAAPGCLHCSKHGGRAALRVVQAIAAAAPAATAAAAPRRVLFVAASAATADAYRRAAVCVARRAGG